MNPVDDESKWFGYYEHTSKQFKPWGTCSQAVDLFSAENSEPTLAVDLGCGVGKDTTYLAEKGWKVIAVDAEKIAERYLFNKIPDSKKNQVTFTVSTYENFTFPSTQLVNASYALPFCRPENFNALMGRITSAITPNGRFAGHFFGLKDTWANNKTMTFHTKEQVLNFFQDYKIEFYQEDDYDGPSGSGPKHWHVIQIIAKKV